MSLLKMKIEPYSTQWSTNVQQSMSQSSDVLLINVSGTGPSRILLSFVISTPLDGCRTVTPSGHWLERESRTSARNLSASHETLWCPRRLTKGIWEVVLHRSDHIRESVFSKLAVQQRPILDLRRSRAWSSSTRMDSIVLRPCWPPRLL